MKASEEEEEKEFASHPDVRQAVDRPAQQALGGPKKPSETDPPRMTEADWREVYLAIGKLVPKKS